jgi:protein-S-isoprenylcysteine O-methyltransferase Ste14
VKIFEGIINLIYQSARGEKSIRRWWTPVGALFFGSFLLLMLMVGVALDRYWGLPELLPSLLSLFISVPLLFIGIFLWLWCVILFFRAKGTPVPLNPPPKLIDTGPYAYSRNPMLSGALFMFVALGILIKSIAVTLVITPILILIIVAELKMVEEPELEKRLGDPYRQYIKRVPMFFPKPWRLRGQKNRG